MAVVVTGTAIATPSITVSSALSSFIATPANSVTVSSETLSFIASPVNDTNCSDDAGKALAETPTVTVANSEAISFVNFLMISYLRFL